MKLIYKQICCTINETSYEIKSGVIMDPIYITGHLNPDTDSIVSAMAYAALRNALGDRQYKAARLGNVSDETQAILDYFSIEAPKLITNVRTQIRDLEYDTFPILGRTVTVNKAWETLKESKKGSACVVDSEGKLFGVLTTGDIAAHVMNSVYEFSKENVKNFDVSDMLSLPIEKICCTEDIQFFCVDDYIDDVKDLVLRTRFRSYPIVDSEGVVLGSLGRFHLIRHNRKKVVLVDHNELSQSVPGLKQAEILEIIDHHRLADIQTNAPIFFRNEPLGSTATIVAGMYREKGVNPDKTMAGLLAAAIISDTVMFKSPTCTQVDIDTANRLAKIAEIDLEELSEVVFSSTSSDKPVSELIYSDFKEFHIAGYKLGIGQITCLNSDLVLERKQEFLNEMENKKKQSSYDYILLMLTDVLKEGTVLLYLGDSDTISQAYDVKAENNEVFLPKVMSRKKQVVPRLSELWG